MPTNDPNPTILPAMGKFGGLSDPHPQQPPITAQQVQKQRSGQAASLPSTQPESTSVQQQLEGLLNPSTLTGSQVYGKDAAVLAQQIIPLIGQLPLNEYNAILQKIPAGSPLATAIQQGLNPQTQTAAKPYFDPLGLQTMWASVFGPAFDQASKIAGGSGQTYMDSMSKLISGSNESPSAKANQTNQAQAMSQLLQQFAKSSVQGVPEGLTMDSIIQALQQASGSAQLAQGQAEKAIAYGTAAAYTNPTSLGVGGAGAAGGLGPVEASALLNNALSGAQTSSPYSGTGLLP